jgi:hypothetical protein
VTPSKRARTTHGSSPKESAGTRPWRKTVVSAAAAVTLIVIGAVLTPVLQKVVDSWFHHEDPLKLNYSWPVGRGCDAGTQIAVTNRVASPSLSTEPDTEIRSSLVRAGAASFGLGHLNLSLSTSGGSTVQVLALEPIIYVKKEPLVDWVFSPQGGCGDTYTRKFDLDLDKATIKDAGVDSGDSGGEGSTDAALRADPLGPAFNVSEADPALLEIDAASCTGYFEWGLRIVYSYNGKELHRVIGTADAPFRSTGKPAGAVAQYSEDPGASGALSRSGTADSPWNCNSHSR